MTTIDRTTAVLTEVCGERARQDAKWGIQNHADGTGAGCDKSLAVQARNAAERAVRESRLTWQLILDEEVREAFAEPDKTRLREELIQVAAVACAWVEKLDREKEEGK